MRSPEHDDRAFRDSLERLREAQGVPVRPAGWPPPEAAGPLTETEYDFFLSFTHPQVDHAREVAAILREEGYRVYLCDQVERPGDLQAEIVTAVQVSQRIVCLLSRGYFQSQYCRRELASFRERSDADAERRVIFLEVEPCVVPDYYRSLGRVELAGWRRGSADYRAKVLAAVRGAAAAPPRQFAIYGPAEEAADEPRQRLTPGVRPAPRSPAWHWAPAGLLAIGFAYYGAYFTGTERAKWDLREATVHWSVGRDISLPWRFTTARHDFREAVATTEPWARELWTGVAGRAASLRPSADALTVGRGISLLKSTLPSEGTLDDVIAQYRTVLDGARLNLLADVQPGGQAYRGFQVAQEPGALSVFYVEKPGAGMAESALHVARPPVNAASTLHDLGMSRDGDFFTLYRNREVVATSPKRPQNARAWAAGAFGLEARGRGRVQLYRWSLSGVRRGEESARLIGAPARWFAFAAPR